MTTVELKENRAQIIEFIDSRGFDLKFAMEMAVELASGCDTLDELFEELAFNCKPVREGKIARLMAENCEREGTRYNSTTKNFEKI
jgi:hypothetical protein